MAGIVTKFTGTCQQARTHFFAFMQNMMGMAAKNDVKTFQEKVVVFRACLDEASANPDNTPGNTQAIVDSYNYSVEMEERVANRFNEAVRDFKERQAAAGG